MGEAEHQAPGFVAISKFVIANGLAPEVREAFRVRPHLVDQAPGYLRMEVITPRERPDEFWLMTFWKDEQSFQNWHRSHAYHQSHRGIPKGLKLIPTETELRFFDHICS